MPALSATQLPRPRQPLSLFHAVACSSDASISLFQFRYDVDTIFTKYRDNDIDIDIKYASEMHILFADLNFNGGHVVFTNVHFK